MDGRVLPASAASVPVTDRGFLYGDGLFETLRTRGRRVFRLGEHLGKLSRSGRYLGIGVPKEIRAAAAALLEQRPLEDGALRIILTRGRGRAGLYPRSEEPHRLVLTLGEAPPFEVERPLEARLVTVRVPRQPLEGHKTLCYLPSVVALGQAGGGREAIMLDERDHLAQCSSSNLFWVSPEGEVRTPSAWCGIRTGVTRDVVIALCSEAGIPFAEGEFPAAELREAREVFGTSSLRGLAPVARVDETEIGDGAVGPATRGLMRAYRDLFDRETALAPAAGSA